MNDEYIWDLVNEVLQTLKFMLTCITLHLHVLSLVMQLYARLKAHKFILTSVLNVTRYQINLDIGTKHRVAFGKFDPINENRKIGTAGGPVERNSLL